MSFMPPIGKERSPSQHRREPDRREKVGTRGERGFAIFGIVAGFLSSIIAGIIALYSYRAWQEERRSAPWFAWFCGWYFLAVFVGIVGATVAGASEDEIDQSLGWLLLLGVVAGVALMYLMSQRSRRAKRPSKLDPPPRPDSLP